MHTGLDGASLRRRVRCRCRGRPFGSTHLDLGRTVAHGVGDPFDQCGVRVVGEHRGRELPAGAGKIVLEGRQEALHLLRVVVDSADLVESLLGCRDVVLRGQHQILHQHADADAQHEHRQGDRRTSQQLHRAQEGLERGCEVARLRANGVTMLLPHGYEGQGPEHSSARLERFMQLCAEHNIQVCVPTTPAQVYHMLRRQVIRPLRKPLVVMSPKSLLRHKEAISTLEELAHGRFHNVLDETDDLDKSKVERVILCSGKVFYDLRAARRERGLDNIAILRLEQLYPFPEAELLRPTMTEPSAETP